MSRVPPLWKSCSDKDEQVLPKVDVRKQHTTPDRWFGQLQGHSVLRALCVCMHRRFIRLSSVQLESPRDLSSLHVLAQNGGQNKVACFYYSVNQHWMLSLLQNKHINFHMFITCVTVCFFFSYETTIYCTCQLQVNSHSSSINLMCL